MTSTAVAKRDAFRELLAKIEDDVTRVLPKHMKAPRFLDLVRVAASQNTKLRECTPESVMTGVIEAATLGLEIGGARQQAALVPYGSEAQFQPMYRGLIELATRDGKVKAIEAHVIHKADRFRNIQGTTPILEHEPVLEGDPGPTIGAYAIAWLADGTPKWEVMTRAQLDKVQKSSRAQGASSPWANWPDEMRRKTAVKRLCKYLPCSPDLAQAIEIDNRHVGIEEADFEIIKETKLKAGRHPVPGRKKAAPKPKAESKSDAPAFNVKEAADEIQEAIEKAIAAKPQDDDFLKAFDATCEKLGRTPKDWHEAGESVIESLLGTVRDLKAAQE